MIAGDWISDRTAVEKVVREAPAQIQELISWVVNFDKTKKEEFDLHREGRVIRSFVSCTMPTIREPRYRRA